MSVKITDWYWAIAFSIRTPPPPPVEDLPFLLTHEDWLKLHLSPKTSIKYGLTPEEYGFSPEEFRKNWSLTPDEFHIFLLYP